MGATFVLCPLIAPKVPKDNRYTFHRLNAHDIISLSVILFAASSVLFVSASSSNEDDGSCRLYLGPSSTSKKDIFKLGIYSGVDLPPGSTIGTPDIAVQLIDILKQDEKSDEEIVTINFWTSFNTLGQFEGDDVTTFVTGLGSLLQEHPSIVNAFWDPPNVLFHQQFQEEGGKDKEMHPGRGAYSTYNHVTFSTRQFVPAGMELFIDIGKGPSDRNIGDNEEVLQNRFDHNRADEILDHMVSFFTNHESKLTEQSKTDIYDFLTNDVMGATLSSLLPQAHDKLQAIKDMGGTTLYKNPRVLVDQEWLDMHGHCIDNIVPQRSTIVNAGMGAFAKRSFTKGEVVTILPLLFIADKKNLDMKHVVGSMNQESGDEHVAAPQLLLNYCFGHPQSSMALLPVVTAGSLINHQSGRKSNVQLQWSKSRIQRSDLLQVSPEHLNDHEKYNYPVLAMDVISTRDIEKGEEIFLDYGPDWEHAWKKHEEEWASNSKEDRWTFQSAYQWNLKHQTTPHQVDTEGSIPDGILRICYILYEELPDREEIKCDGVSIRKFIAQNDESSAYAGRNAYECKLLSKEGYGGETDVSSCTYRVSIIESTEEGDIEIIIEGIPHNAVWYIDAPYRSDQHNSDAFRHTIGIPEDIWPEAWLNIFDRSDDEL
mmetsp:Transcript_5727/g.8727  ORF Transcript_5727/g.8727 Transcript_5727/m.8727 type:complete len:653 (-) Transcript_5727:597-2555(-)